MVPVDPAGSRPLNVDAALVDRDRGKVAIDAQGQRHGRNPGRHCGPSAAQAHRLPCACSLRRWRWCRWACWPALTHGQTAAERITQMTDDKPFVALGQLGQEASRCAAPRWPAPIEAGTVPPRRARRGRPASRAGPVVVDGHHGSGFRGGRPAKRIKVHRISLREWHAAVGAQPDRLPRLPRLDDVSPEIPLTESE